MTKTVYLAGPIAGLTEKEAKDWRKEVDDEVQFKSKGIRCISPLRCEPPIKGKYDIPHNGQGEDKCFGIAQAIGSKNYFDVQTCDMILGYLPSLSIGTLIELGWGRAFNKPVIVVTQEPDFHFHPVIQHCASWSLDTLDEAIEVIIGVLEDYA